MAEGPRETRYWISSGGPLSCNLQTVSNIDPCDETGRIEECAELENGCQGCEVHRNQPSIGTL